MAQSASSRKTNLRNRKITVAAYLYTHVSTDLDWIAKTMEVHPETVEKWQSAPHPKWHGEMEFWKSPRVKVLGLHTETGEVEGSLDTFEWIWANILQDGIDFKDIDRIDTIAGFKMRSENEVTINQIGIENPLKRFGRLAVIGCRNTRALIRYLRLVDRVLRCESRIAAPDNCSGA